MTEPGDVVGMATWNVRTALGLDGWRSWPLRRRGAAAVLASLACDVVGLQEVRGRQLRWLRRALPDHVAVGEGRDVGGWGERCPLLVGPALRIVRHRTLWLSHRPTVPGTRLPGAAHPRVATFAELEVRGSGRRAVVVNTHLDHRLEANRLTGVELVLGWLDPGLPAVVLGDLNAAPRSAPLTRLAAAGFVSVLPGAAGGTAHGFTGRVDGPRIDHVLVRGAWEVVHAQVVHSRPDGRPPSDHWPVRAALRLVPAGSGPVGPGPAGSAHRFTGPALQGRTIQRCGSASSAPTA